jgi:hypothetical protein
MDFEYVSTDVLYTNVKNGRPIMDIPKRLPEKMETFTLLRCRTFSGVSTFAGPDISMTTELSPAFVSLS